MSQHTDEFHEFRQKMNEALLATGNKIIQRVFSLDTLTYRDGALPARTKELLGLVASLVLRCDDCVRYHLEQCHAAGYSKDEIIEACSVGLVVGGTIVIPHLRRAMAVIEELYSE